MLISLGELLNNQITLIKMRINRIKHIIKQCKWGLKTESDIILERHLTYLTSFNLH
jgi:hypothetical protein